MTRPRTGPQRSVGLATLTAILILTDGALAAIGLLVVNAWRNGNLSGAEAATFTVLGASAAAGAVIMLLATVALVRGVRGQRAGRLASGLAWLRLAGLLIALPAVAILLGGAALVGGFETFGAALALADALVALIVTGAATRRTRQG